MRSRDFIRWSAAVLLLVLVCGDAATQPRHHPGTICFTPYFWCWANPPGLPGRVCYCPSPRGPVPGRLG